MKNKLTWIASLLSLFLLIVACEETTTPDPPVAPNAPTDLMANSTNETTVTLKWTKPATGQEPTGYIVTVTESGSTASTNLNVAGANTTTLPVTGLTEGKIYIFSVMAVNDTAKSNPTPQLSWAPAKRFSGTFKLYTSKSTSQGSGLSFREGRVVMLSEASKWEFCFDDKDGRPLVGSPGVSGYTPPGSQEFPIVSMDTAAANWVRANSLDEVFDTRGLDGGAKSLLDLSRFTPNSGIVLIMRSRVDGSTVNYAKVLVKPNTAGGSWVFGSGNDAYIEVEVSYQTVVNVPYAEMERLFGGVKRGNNRVE